MSETITEKEEYEKKKKQFYYKCYSCCNRYNYCGNKYFCNDISDMIDNIGENSDYNVCGSYNRWD